MNTRLFPMRESIYLVPHWVITQLRRAGLKGTDLLDYSKVSSILSMNDKISIETMQSFTDLVYGDRDAGGSPTFIYEWVCSAKDEIEQRELAQFREIAKDPHQRDIVLERLYSEGSASKYEQPFEVLAVEDKCVLVVLYPSFFVDSQGNQTHESHQASVVARVLKQLYVHDQQPAVAGTRLFRRYLEQLDAQRVSAPAVS